MLSWLAAQYLRLVGATSRIIWVNRTIRQELEETRQGFVYAFWHGRQAFLVYLHARDRIHPLISQSRDGELIARVCRAFGGLDVIWLQAIAGGMSARNAATIL